MEINKIQSVYTVVNDMDKLLDFYSKVLGNRPKFRDADRWAQFGVGNTNFALSSRAEAAPRATASVIVFEAESLEGVREEIVAAGGVLVAERNMGAHGTVLSFTDPEGHPFQVFSKKTPASASPTSQQKGQS
ncbi:VOC family protein [Variovorax sp. Root411]|uniref:VOC family protein n=1 Tax=Variovorax sp. Root411 TaxID=1736530 RepID=UPI0006FB15CC|nr:VOC family protein [Variovorax sp. Root411]KQW54571.1 glyoxalase [Variovorax sp. Root411]